MLLNYLYANFFEEGQFAAAAGTTLAELKARMHSRVFPAPSYVFDSNGRSVSFVRDAPERVTYRFHLRGHTDWFGAVTRLGLDSEHRARAHFFSRYAHARDMFLTSDLGRDLTDFAPEIPARFNADHATSTWAHFLNGVYGVCTRDGQPETVFLKQVGVMFVDRLSADGPDVTSEAHLELLKRAVAFLDAVESDFAPHETEHASRQRCIIDIRARFFEGVAV